MLNRYDKTSEIEWGKQVQLELYKIYSLSRLLTYIFSLIEIH